MTDKTMDRRATAPMRRQRGGKVKPGPIPLPADPSRLEPLLGDLRLGMWTSAALAKHRIAEGSFYLWLRRGRDSVQAVEEAEAEGVEVPDPVEPWHSFFLAVEEARATAEHAAMVRVRAAGQDRKVTQLNREGQPVEVTIPGDWRAEAWFLERGPARQRWGQRIEVAGDPDKPITVRQEPQPIYPAAVQTATVIAALAAAGVLAPVDPRKVIEVSEAI